MTTMFIHSLNTLDDLEDEDNLYQLHYYTDDEIDKMLKYAKGNDYDCYYTYEVVFDDEGFIDYHAYIGCTQIE